MSCIAKPVESVCRSLNGGSSWHRVSNPYISPKKVPAKHIGQSIVAAAHQTEAGTTWLEA